MTNHWDRPGWTSSTRAYYWMLTFPDADLLIDQARHCQKELRPLGFDDVDEDALHLTLGRIGTVEQVAPGQLHRLIAAAHAARPEAFNLRAVPLTASRGAIRYSVAPWISTIDLHAALSRAGSVVGLSPKKPTSALRPHIGIAYSNRRMPAHLVRDAVLPLRALDSVTVPVRRVQLVELRREGHTYRWDVIHELELR
ncbi:2'-5' RNA ligase family protein [Streptomyces sp. NBC_01304]|uniref:2'-5' RNA ligase family protein n=1 Tax=Streptomyces sp. NBC_01304 TaxID=2903818 RepID=UPI002E0F601F|nr:2'-5' RNA ligase family protein [Streptomyces sp. NBC_01304]